MILGLYTHHLGMNEDQTPLQYIINKQKYIQYMLILPIWQEDIVKLNCVTIFKYTFLTWFALETYSLSHFCLN